MGSIRRPCCPACACASSGSGAIRRPPSTRHWPTSRPETDAPPLTLSSPYQAWWWRHSSKSKPVTIEMSGRHPPTHCKPPQISWEDFHDWTLGIEGRAEWVDGEIIEVVGDSIRHYLLVHFLGNLLSRYVDLKRLGYVFIETDSEKLRLIQPVECRMCSSSRTGTVIGSRAHTSMVRLTSRSRSCRPTVRFGIGLSSSPNIRTPGFPSTGWSTSHDAKPTSTCSTMTENIARLRSARMASIPRLSCPDSDCGSSGSGAIRCPPSKRHSPTSRTCSQIRRGRSPSLRPSR